MPTKIDCIRAIRTVASGKFDGTAAYYVALDNLKEEGLPWELIEHSDYNLKDALKFYEDHIHQDSFYCRIRYFDTRIDRFVEQDVVKHWVGNPAEDPWVLVVGMSVIGSRKDHAWVDSKRIEPGKYSLKATFKSILEKV